MLDEIKNTPIKKIRDDLPQGTLSFRIRNSIKLHFLPEVYFKLVTDAQIHAVDSVNFRILLPGLVPPKVLRGTHFLSQEILDQRVNDQNFICSPRDPKTTRHNEDIYWLLVDTLFGAGEVGITTGINAILKDAVTKGRKSILMAPLGFDTFVASSTADMLDDEDSDWSDLVWDDIQTKQYCLSQMRIAVENLLKMLPDDYALDLYVSADSYETFWLMSHEFKFPTGWDRNISKDKRTLPEKIQPQYKKLIERARTDNTEYKKSLAELALYLDEDIPLILLGETGVGKSTLAQIIHKVNRGDRQMEEINCAALDRHNFPVEILGHEKHAFTDAKIMRKGIFERAKGGTVLLDEIDKLVLSEQGSLLTILSNNKVRRMGGKVDIDISDVRIIFGTNANLPKLVSEGRLLRDLYRRILKGIPIEIPALRDRREDIPLFAEVELRSLNKYERKANPDSMESAPERFTVWFDRDAFSHLTTYHWPFNVGELADYLKKVFIRAKKEGISNVTVNYLKKHPPMDPYQFQFQEDGLEEFERVLLQLIKAWDEDIDGHFRNDFIYPVLAKVAYKDWQGEKKGTQGVAGDRVGITGHGTEKTEYSLKYYIARYPAAVSTMLNAITRSR